MIVRVVPAAAPLSVTEKFVGKVKLLVMPISKTVSVNVDVNVIVPEVDVMLRVVKLLEENVLAVMLLVPKPNVPADNVKTFVTVNGLERLALDPEAFMVKLSIVFDDAAIVAEPRIVTCIFVYVPLALNDNDVTTLMAAVVVPTVAVEAEKSNVENHEPAPY